MGQQLNYWSELKKLKSRRKEIKKVKKSQVQIIKPEVK